MRTYYSFEFHAVQHILEANKVPLVYFLQQDIPNCPYISEKYYPSH